MVAVDLAALRSIEREKEISFETLDRRARDRAAHRLQAHRALDAARPGRRSTARAARSSSGRRTSAPDGEIVEEYDDTPTDFGRVAAMTARQVILQRLRDAEHDQTFGEYSGREGDIVTGVVQADAQAAQRGLVLVDIGKVEAILPQSEQVPGEEYTHGTRIRAYVVGVDARHARPAGDGQPHPPEPGQEAVRARGARDRRRQRRDRRRRPRGRAPHQDRGPHAPSTGSTPRARASGRWASGCATSSPSCTARRSTSSTGPRIRRPTSATRCRRPTRVSSRGRRPPVTAVAVRVVVPDFQLSLAIGREGQNARLAARLTGHRIDIHSDAEAEPRRRRSTAGPSRRSLRRAGE